MKRDFPALSTTRLRLDHIADCHSEQLIEIAAFKVPYATHQDALDLIEKLDEAFINGTGLTWGIYLDGQLIGTVGYYRGFENKTGEIGYVMREAFKRRRYMFEAIQKALQFGFETLNLNRITAYTEITNTASVQMLEKLGFRNTQAMLDKYSIFELLGSS